MAALLELTIAQGLAVLVGISHEDISIDKNAFYYQGKVLAHCDSLVGTITIFVNNPLVNKALEGKAILNIRLKMSKLYAWAKEKGGAVRQSNFS